MSTERCRWSLPSLCSLLRGKPFHTTRPANQRGDEPPVEYRATSTAAQAGRVLTPGWCCCTLQKGRMNGAISCGRRSRRSHGGAACGEVPPSIFPRQSHWQRASEWHRARQHRTTSPKQIWRLIAPNQRLMTTGAVHCFRIPSRVDCRKRLGDMRCRLHSNLHIDHRKSKSDRQELQTSPEPLRADPPKVLTRKIPRHSSVRRPNVSAAGRDSSRSPAADARTPTTSAPTRS